MASRTARQKEIAPPPSPTRLLFMFACAFLGLAISVFLAYEYLTGAGIPCTDVGCDQVRQWHDNKLPRGTIPLMGTLFFALLVTTTLKAGFAKGKQIETHNQINLLLGAVGTLVMILLMIVGVIYVRATCIWCLMIAAATIVYAITAWNEWRQRGKEPPSYLLDFEPFVKWAAIPFLFVFLLSQAFETHTLPAAPEPSEPVSSTTEDGQLIEQSFSEVYLQRESAATKGSEVAPITIVEFADPGCGACGRLAVTMNRILEEYPDQVRLVYRHFPLRSHANSRLAAQAIEAAGAQGKFWEMQDKLFQNIGAQTRDFLLIYAEDLGLDIVRFTRDLDSGEFADEVQEDRSDGEALGVKSTPTIFINGKYRLTNSSYENLKSTIDQILAEDN